MSINFDIKQIVFSHNELQTNYAKADYDKVLAIKKSGLKDKSYARPRDHCLFYLLANWSSDSVIRDYIKVKEKKREFKALFSKDKDFNERTPLILAAALGRLEVVRLLIEIIKSDESLAYHMNSCDEFGWTPLHFAAITSDKIFQLLKNSGADVNARTRAGGTPADIIQLISRDVKSISADKVYWETAEGFTSFAELIQTGTLGKITGLKGYRDISYVPPSSLSNLLTHVPEPTVFGQMQRTLVDKYLEYIKGRKVPTFFVAVEDTCKKEGFFAVRGLQAKEELEEVDVVGSYAGELWNLHKGSAYKAGNIDALDYADNTRYMNWAPANVVWEDIPGEGVEVTLVLAAKKIKKDDFLYLHYGAKYLHTPMYKPFIIFNKTQLDEFFRDGLAVVMGRWEMIKDHLKSKNLKERIHAMCFRDNLEYPLCCPGAILYLHFKGIVNINEWKKAPSWPVFAKWRESANKGEYRSIIATALRATLEIEKSLQNDHARLKRFGDWVLNQIGRTSFADIQVKLEKFRINLSKQEKLDFDI